MAAIEDLLLERDLTSPELQRMLGVSQPTVSRLLQRAGNRVARIGRGRATRYAAARRLFGADWSVPLHTVDKGGVVRRIATLRALADGRTLVDGGAHAPPWLLGDSGVGLYSSLPYFIADLRPSGFLGRQLGRRLAAEWGTAPDPREWTDDDLGRFLLQRADDLPGTLLLGDTAAARVSRRQPATGVRDRRAEYPLLALRALDDDAPGSSAAGEQPKFAVEHVMTGPVIVKFSPAAMTADAQRWRDLLRAEDHALRLLREHGLPAAETSMHSLEERVFLESRRFDRLAGGGRVGAISLTMIDAEFVGAGHGWTSVARGLRARGLIDERTLEHLLWLELFGEWIGNTDMHLGNVSLSPRPDGFELLPLYDMLPMALAPVRGELPAAAPRTPPRTAERDAAWAAAGAAATTYWLRLADDPALSDGFCALARDHGARLRQLLGG